MTVLLETLARAVDHLEPVVDILIHLGGHIGIGHLDTVDLSLMLEEFLYGDLLGDDTIGVAIPFLALHGSLYAHGLDIRLQDGLIANNPDHLIDDRAFLDIGAVRRTSITSMTSKTSITSITSKGRPEEGEAYEQGDDMISCLHQ